MPNWKDSLGKISGQSVKQRESAFEAAMLAEIAKSKPTQTSKPATTPSPKPAIVAPAANTIAITVTENGKTTTYPDLASVPVPLRQKIVNAWLADR